MFKFKFCVNDQCECSCLNQYIYSGGILDQAEWSLDSDLSLALRFLDLTITTDHIGLQADRATLFWNNLKGSWDTRISIQGFLELQRAIASIDKSDENALSRAMTFIDIG